MSHFVMEELAKVTAALPEVTWKIDEDVSQLPDGSCVYRGVGPGWMFVLVIAVDDRSRDHGEVRFVEGAAWGGNTIVRLTPELALQAAEAAEKQIHAPKTTEKQP